jgi:hypothetical protein
LKRDIEMAKSRNTRRHVTGTTVTTKSWFGSHADMVVEEIWFDPDSRHYLAKSGRLSLDKW